MSGPNESCWMIVMEFANYPGNFEREMCAYATGVTGDDGVGGEEAELFFDLAAHEAEHWLASESMLIDGLGGARPVALWGADQWSVAFFYESCPPRRVFELVVSRAGDYSARRGVPMKSARVVEYVVERREVVHEP